MKKLLSGLPIFLVAFATGYLIVPLGSHADKDLRLPVVHQPSQQESVSADVPKEYVKDEFIPEFRDLPNFQDLEYTEPVAKLIDTFAYGGKDIYRESEVPAKSGEIWFGLFKRNGQFTLEKTKVTTCKLRSNSFPGDELDVHLKLNRPGDAVFIIKGIPSLKLGRIVTNYHRPSWDEIENRGLEVKSMSIGYNEQFRLGNREYVLRVAPGMTRNNDPVNVLVLQTGTKTQAVTYNQYFKDQSSNYDIIGDLLWAGDLDKDGKLDLYFSNFNYEKGGFSSNLYLSSAASEDELVRQVASFASGGC